MTPNQIQAVVERMRCFFIGTGLKTASRETVLKWAREIEDALRKEK